MIRVGFVLAMLGKGWMGGLNYYRNLLQAIYEMPDRQIEPVIIVTERTGLLDDFPPFEVLETDLFRSKWGNRARMLTKVLFGKDVALERFLRAHQIDVLSHYGDLGRRSKLTTIGWMADLQHKLLPELFSARALGQRNRFFEGMAQNCSAVLLSSESAKNDYCSIYAEHSAKARVLHFTCAPSVDEATSLDQLCEKYEIGPGYFYLPNQFWKHKNHVVVVDALKCLEDAGIHATVVCTGNTVDGRHPQYFSELMHHADSIGVADHFRVLGIVPYNDVVGLMLHSAAVINPSKFEGWSTTVEESKSLGKAILLSDIAVHIEQKPARGQYFAPDSPAQLGSLMATVIQQYSALEEASLMNKNKLDAALERNKYATEYQGIVQDVLYSKASQKNA